MNNFQSLVQYSPRTGANAVSADGTLKLLGSHAANPYEIMIRECAQNSWDAKLSTVETPSFYVDVRHFDERQAIVLQNSVFKKLEDVEPELAIATRKIDSLSCIEIVDRGTSGLNGEPTISAPKHDNFGRPLDTNFRDLIFTLGATRDTELGGGTYGFGKVAAFGVSKAKTLIYWTRCWYKGELQHRLIASHIGRAFQKDDNQHIGRHWWGDRNGTEFIPVLGDRAQQIGEAVFNHHFHGDETGTNILVIDPVEINSVEHENNDEPQTSSPQEDKSLPEQLRDFALVNLWPKMTARSDGTLPMDIRIFEDGIEVPMRQGDELLWSLWAEALNLVRDLEEGEESPIPAGQEDHTYLGTIGYKRMTDGVRDLGSLSILREGPVEPVSPFERLMVKRNRTICRMRAPELVVNYLQAGIEADEDTYVCGVFKVLSTPEVDEAFASAENPTHDEWNTGQLAGNNKTFKNRVDRAERDVRKAFATFLNPTPEIAENSDSRINQEVSEFLGELLPRASVVTEGPSTPKPRGGTTGKKQIKTPEISNFEFGGSTGSKQVQWVRVSTPDSPTYEFDVHLEVSAYGEIKDKFDDSELEIFWTNLNDTADMQIGAEARVVPGATYATKVQAPAGYALETRLVVDRKVPTRKQGDVK